MRQAVLKSADCPWQPGILLCILGLLLDSPEIHAQPKRPSASLEQAIDKLVERFGITSQTPGVAVLIQKPGKLHFQKAYGLTNVERNQPITRHTMFELASVSKTFTATAVLILHDRGKLSIDDDIRTLLTEIPEFRKDHPIRIRDLLHHTSGLPDYMGFENVPMRHQKYSINDDYLSCFARDRLKVSLDFPTGEKYEYNNTNYMLLATIVERAAKRPFGQFLKSEIFDPAGMEHSFVYSDPKSIPEAAQGFNHAIGYEWRKKKEIWEPGWGTPPDRHETMLTVGDGGIWTNLDDMSKWDLAIRERKFLKPETWKLALAPSKTRDGKINGYGLGWSLYFEEPKNFYGYGHDGSWGGFRTSYYRYLAADRTTVLLSNRGNFDTDKFWENLDKLIEKHHP